MNYYNEWDAGAAAWLRELIKAGHLPPGYVDERSITELTPSDLEGFTQCHFFAGIGGWSYALALAGVPATTRLWTGSPPCQPFSVAGKQLGQLDERHLAPTFMRLIAQCHPPVLFGEQVAAAIGKHWLDDLFTELEAEGYACGAAVLPACSVGAPHKRDRLFFGASLGNANSERHYGVDALLWQDKGERRERSVPETSRPSEVGALADTLREQRNRGGDVRARRGSESPDRCSNGGLAHTNSQQQRSRGGRGARADDVPTRREQDTATASGLCSDNAADSHHGFWSDVDWLGCWDGKFRPVEPGTFPLAHGIPARVGRLRGYGNAILPQVAAEFIKAFEGAISDCDGANNAC